MLKKIIPLLLIILTSVLIYKNILPVWMGCVWVLSAWYFLMQFDPFKIFKK